MSTKDPAKLTLRLDSHLIARAKQYAHERGISLSQLVADYFRAVTRQGAALDERGGDWERELGPVTRSLVGVLEGSGLDEEDYHRYLEVKHSGITGEGKPS